MATKYILSKDLFSSNILGAFMLAINKTHRFLLCTKCHKALRSEFRFWRLHLKDFHTGVGLSKKDIGHIQDELKRFQQEYGGSVCDPAPPSSESIDVSPFGGLTIYQGLQCGHCSWVTPHMTVLRKHCKKHHVSLPISWTVCLMQQVQTKQWFAIHLPATATATNSEPTAIPKNISEAVASAKKAIAAPLSEFQPLGPRDISPWLTKTQWHTHTEAYPTAELIGLVRCPSSRSPLGSIVKSYFTEIVGWLHGSTDRLVLQKLNTEAENMYVVSILINILYTYSFSNWLLLSSPLNHTPFGPLQEEESLLRYIRIVTQLISMLLLQPSLHYSIPLPNEVDAHLAHFRAMLDDGGPSNPKDGHLALHQLLMAIWKRAWNPTPDNDFPCPTIRFLILHSLQADGAHVEPTDITGPIAKLKYCIRLAFLREIKLIAKDRYQGIDYSACVDIEHWIHQGNPSPFNSLCSLTQLASAIAMNTLSMPQIWLDAENDPEKLIYHGDPINFADLRRMFVVMEKTLIDQWEKEVLLGIKDLHVQCPTIKEDLSCVSVGYCFLDDSRNVDLLRHNNQDKFLTAIASDPALCEKFFTFAGDQWDWDVLQLKKWLEQYSKLSLLLLVRCEMLSGAPGRSTELTSMSYRSTSTRVRRNLSILGSHLAIIRTYQKTTSMIGLDKLIPHSLDAVTADIMIQDLLLIRPFATWAATVCYPSQAEEMRNLYQYRLFVNQNKLFTSDNLSTIMSAFSLDIVGFGITIRSWRHIFVAFRRRLCPEAAALLEQDPTNEDTAAILQLGHGRRVENMKYAVSSQTLQGSSENILPLYLNASKDWQILCHMVPGMFFFAYLLLFNPYSLGGDGHTIRPYWEVTHNYFRPELYVRTNSNKIVPSINEDMLAEKVANVLVEKFADTLVERVSDSLVERVEDSLVERVADSLTKRVADSLVEKAADAVMEKVADAISSRLVSLLAPILPQPIDASPIPPVTPISHLLTLPPPSASIGSHKRPSQVDSNAFFNQVKHGREGSVTRGDGRGDGAAKRARLV